MQIFLYLSFLLLVWVGGFAWLISINGVQYFEQRKVGMISWLCFGSTAAFLMTVGGWSTNKSIAVVLLVSAIGFLIPKVADLFLRMIFKDPAGTIHSPKAPIK